jgi:ribokinase
MVGAVGSDEFGRAAVRALEQEGVDTGAVAVHDEATGVAVILVDAEGENQIVVAPGANRLLVAEAVALAAHDAVLCQLEIPVETVVAAAERCTGLFCLNAAPARAVPPSLLRRADLVVVNRLEFDALTETPRLVALTLGADGGVLLEEGREVARAQPPSVTAVDGTAAGDAFTACLVVSLLEQRPHDDALRRACAAGALAASRPGAQPSLPTGLEIDWILARQLTE